MLSGTTISWLRPVIGLLSQPARLATSVAAKTSFFMFAMLLIVLGFCAAKCARNSVRLDFCPVSGSIPTDSLAPQEARQRARLRASAALDPRGRHRNPG